MIISRGSTGKQLIATRANAKRSSGPKAATGKALSRARTNCETIVIGDEDPKAFDVFRAELEEEYNSRPGIESELVERLAVLMWRMRRVPVFETTLIELRRNSVYNSPEPVIALQNSQSALGTLLPYEAALMNAFNRTLQQLLFLQERRARDENNGEEAALMPQPASLSFEKLPVPDRA